MGKPLGVLMFLLVILKVLGTAEADHDCSCTSSECDCRNQGLTSVPQDLPEAITELDLGQNEITTLSQSDFSRYASLVKLSLDYNQITDLPSDIFTGLGNLQELILFKNDISDTSILAGTFNPTPQLRTLDLGLNGLITLRANMFSGLGNLQELRLYGNDISKIPDGTFRSMPQLKVLSLNNNKLTSLRPDMFTGLGNLEILSLQINEITNIQVGTFSPMPNVNELRLQANSIITFPFEDLSNIQTISRLHLFNNQMTTLPSLAHDVLSSIYDVNIANNPWQCDCRMVDFKMKMTEPSSLDKQITCSQPEDLNGQRLIDVNPEDLMTNCQKPKIARFERIGNHPLIQGETLRLVCEAFGIPTPDITVTPPSGFELNATEEVTVWPNGTVVVRVTVAADDSGQYVCIAANFNGSTLANFSADVISPKFSPSFSLPTLISNSAGSTLSYFSTEVVNFETSPSFSLPILILYLIGAVAGTLVVVAIVLAIWCKCCRKDRPVAVGPDTGVVVLSTGPPAMMYSGHGARVAWGHPMAMSRV